MVNKADIEKLNRFSKGISDAEEEKYIYSLFVKNEENREFKKHIQNEFDEYLRVHPEENYDLSYLLDRIHHIINKKENQKKDTVIKRIYSWYSVAAAVLLIPLIVGGGIWFFGQSQEEAIIAEAPLTSTLFAPLGSRISFSLPDGTQGWLNSGSSFNYSIPFSSNRQIDLIGEAWFDVVHDTEHPFRVSAGNSMVEVLGTKFNLNAYPEEKYMEVTLEEGKVVFSTPGLSSGIEMKEDDRLVLSEGEVNISSTDASKYSAWKEGKLVFRGDNMDEVARRIGRWYNVNVLVMDEDLKEYSFRAIFEDDSLEELLKYLSMTSPIRYQIVPRKILDDGTVQKKKVLLYKKQ